MSNLKNNTTQLEALLVKVNALPEVEGTDTSDATATADEIFAGETAYVNGEKVTGTFIIEEELTKQNDLISQITTLVTTKANPPGSSGDNSCLCETINATLLMRSTATGSVIYTIRDMDGSLACRQDTFNKMGSTYGCSIEAVALCNTPIVIISSGTITFTSGTLITSGTGYAVYNISEPLSSGGNDGPGAPGNDGPMRPF